jgi:hypothetical protein
MRYFGLSFLLMIVLIAPVHGETIAVWNFNDAATGVTGGELEFSVDRGSGEMSSDFNSANIGNTSGSSVNIEGEDPAGAALRLSGSANNGRYLTWMTGTEGYEAIGVSFAAQRTSTGFLDNLLQYSLDSGVSWLDFGGFSPGTTFGLQSFDFSAITGLDDNPAAGFRIRFDGATGSSGNNRIDNLVVSGTPIPPPVTSTVPEPSSLAFLGFGMAALGLWRRREAAR